MTKPLFTKLTTFLLDLIFPKHCLGCHQYGVYLCDNCFASIPINQKLSCYQCGKITDYGKLCLTCKNKDHPALDGLLIATDSGSDLLHQLIYKFKYNFITELSLPLGNILINFLENNQNILSGFTKEKTILIPVPLSRRRLRWRGFNQSQLLAKEFQKRFGFALEDNVLVRSRHTRPQMEIKDASERRQTIQGAFKLSLPKEDLKNKILVLVDDIATTVATLEECAKALKPLGPKKIFGFVLCRG